MAETISDDTPKGLTMIMRERREKVSKLTHGQSMSRSEIHGVARSAAGDAWSAGHEKEAARQIALKEIRWLEAAVAFAERRRSESEEAMHRVRMQVFLGELEPS